jgi:uncharacterized protein YuzE
MQMHYDPETDALLITLHDVEPVSSLDFEPGVTAALDANGHVIALEILDLRERIADGELGSLSETVHLLRSRTNADRLLASLKRAMAGTGTPTDLTTLQAELNLDTPQPEA